MGLISKVSALTTAFLQELTRLVWMAHETTSELFERTASRKAPFRLEDLFYQTNRVGVGSVPLVSLVSIFIGLTMALLTGYQLKPYGIVTLVPAVVSVAFTRELGPLFAGIMLADRKSTRLNSS